MKEADKKADSSFRSLKVQKLVLSLSYMYYWITNLLYWVLDYLMSSYFHHVIQYSLQNSDNELYSFNFFTLRKNNSLKMTKTTQSVLFWKDIEDSSAELLQDEVTTQREFSNSTDSQEEELCLL